MASESARECIDACNACADACNACAAACLKEDDVKMMARSTRAARPAYSSAAAFSVAALSVFSQLKSGSSRPNWP